MVIAVLLAGFIGPSVLGQTAGTTEAQVKAAFLFNFPRFIDWPQGSINTPQFTICLFDDSLTSALTSVIRNESVGGRPLRVERKNINDSTDSCLVAFIGQSEARSVPGLIRSLNTRAVLTVGEDPDFLKSGGMIRFTRANDRIRFEINPDAAERAKLKISSRLLRLADVEQTREPGGRQ